EADAALLSILRFWTGGDKDKAIDLFGQSGLVRPKWQRADYREFCARRQSFAARPSYSCTLPPTSARVARIVPGASRHHGQARLSGVRRGESAACAPRAV
ncbi:MAG: hypothetical protein QM473_09235, partial [Acidobacteriota bacterium]|nr:hypothetical protein [Acidobacteriota bacterium]